MESTARISDLYTDLLEDLENSKMKALLTQRVKSRCRWLAVGKPNVEKSTSLNQLVDAQRVLTGPMAGVTGPNSHRYGSS